MNGLAQLQNKFQEYLQNVNDDMQENILGTEKVSVETRLSIYKNAYYSRLIEALQSTYPVLNKYLGEEAFEVIMLEYIHHRPSTYRSIRWFGDQLDIFLADHLEYQASPYLSELAKFEWTMSQVFDSANADSILLEEIGKIPPALWENMRFYLHPSVRLVHLKWNVVAIWQALSDDEKPMVPKENEVAVSWITWRKDLISQFCSMPNDEAWAVNAMSQGKSFGEICEGLCQWRKEEDAPMYAASLLKGWVIAGLISKVYVS